MSFDSKVLCEVPALLASRLPAAREVGELTDAGLTGSLAVIGQARRVLDASAALIAAEVDRRSSRTLGVGGLAQRRGHKDGAGLVEELAGIGRGEAAKLIRVGGLLETAEAVAPAVAVPAPDGDTNEPGGGEGSAGVGGGVVPVTPLPRDLAMLRGLPGPWDAPVAVAVRNGWLTAAHGDGLRSGLGNPPPAAVGASSAPCTPGPERDDRSPQAVLAPREAAPHERWRGAVLELIADCWAAQWSPEDLTRAAKRMRAALDTLAAQAEAHARYEARSMKRAVRTTGMVHYDIDLDPESDARFYGPIRRLLSPRFGGPRFTSADDIRAAAELEHDTAQQRATAGRHARRARRARGGHRRQ